MVYPIYKSINKLEPTGNGETHVRDEQHNGMELAEIFHQTLKLNNHIKSVLLIPQLK